MRIKTRIRASIRKNYPNFRALLFREYPRFVFGEGLEGVIPVFDFHQVDTESLERQLSYLKENNYQALDSSEWLDGQRKPRSDRAKQVVLTFDDGHISLWRNAYPLLKQYGYKAVSFICPGLLPDSEKTARPRGERTMCNWEEIRQMHDSGYVDFQSHSLRHDLVFVSAKLEDWLSPMFQSHYFGKYDKAVVLEDDDDFSLTNLWPYSEPPCGEYVGTPMFPLRPRMATDQRFSLSREARDSFCTLARGRMGASAEIGTWRETARKRFRSYRPDELGRYVVGQEYQHEIARELRLARQTIEKKLPGKTVEHFCAPWYSATESALATASDCGYAAVFLGELAYSSKPESKPRDGIGEVPRLSGSYIFRLPGKGRKPLRSVLSQML